MVKLSIIIVTYYGKSMVEDCIKSIISNNDIGDELEIVVSDNSPDHSVAKYISSKYPEIICVSNGKNGGFGYGNNRGAEVAKGKYILFLNPDTIITEPIFRYAIDKFENDSNLALFGVKLVDSLGRSNISHMLIDGFGFFDYFRQKYYWKKDRFISHKMYTSGADIFIRRSIFDRVNGFDENIFMYYEESDLIKRIRKDNADAKNDYYPEKCIIHLEGGTTELNKSKIISLQEIELKSIDYYCRKYNIPFKKVMANRIMLSRLAIIYNMLKRNSEKREENEAKLGVYLKIYKRK